MTAAPAPHRPGPIRRALSALVLAASRHHPFIRAVVFWFGGTFALLALSLGMALGASALAAPLHASLDPAHPFVALLGMVVVVAVTSLSLALRLAAGVWALVIGPLCALGAPGARGWSVGRASANA